MKSMPFNLLDVLPFRAIWVLAWIAALSGGAHADDRDTLRIHVVEDQRVIPPDPRHPPPPAEAADVEQALQQRLEARFVSITGSLDRPMSITQAKLAGWGFVSDNAAAIDRNGDGAISFNELNAFMREHTPARLKQGK